MATCARNSEANLPPLALHRKLLGRLIAIRLCTDDLSVFALGHLWVGLGYGSGVLNIWKCDDCLERR